MSVDTEILSTTDLRTWVEGSTVEFEEALCEFTLVEEGTVVGPPRCPREALLVVIWSCGCDLPICLEHRDQILLGPAKLLPHRNGKMSFWKCEKHHEPVVVSRIESLR